MNLGVIGFLIGMVGVILPYKMKKKFEKDERSDIEIKAPKLYWIVVISILTASFFYLLFFF